MTSTPTISNRRAAQKYTKEQKQRWRTPNTVEQPVIWLVEKALGGMIGCDLTADPDKSVPAAVHITEADDVLKTRIICSPGHSRTGYMNPPFDKPHLFLERVAIAIQRRELTQVITLCKAGVLHNTKSGGIISAHANTICHWGAGKAVRIGFIDHEGFQVKGSDFDCALINFGEGADRFAGVFKDWGMITRIDEA